MSGETVHVGAGGASPDIPLETQVQMLTAQRDRAWRQRNATELVMVNLIAKIQSFSGTDAIANIKASDEFKAAVLAVR